MIVDYSVFTGPAVIAGVLLLVLAVISVVAVIRSQKRAPVAGRESIVGKTAVVQSILDPNGTVLFEGELWHARAPRARIEAGSEVTVIRMEGLTLIVKKEEASDD